ncbi:MAG: FAD-binding protein [Atopobiaceae bacterium]|jgi:uncharacterized FAD-dependent dehydrogenase|nr:FAD-binding protein [Atopobiaceae bacterium]MCH4181489.1 FAD-binding protein [Atopobiaceae bacterium]MCH4214430.1 FAD-binding protein [Atopobiaceae bacterium]MCH4229360.1 FAD-binding protein [Atopobiaceae bacterium]MCH4276682.1 FAD-binding protein [Atopobiaceae bacterium]
MIEVSGIRIPAYKLDGSADKEHRLVMRAVLNKVHEAPDAITSIELRRRSVDARKKANVHLTYTVRMTLRGGANAERDLLARLEAHHNAGGVRQVTDETPHLPLRSTWSLEGRPVVVGAGCAGLFCALALASAGLEPLLVERGDDAERRGSTVHGFNATGTLDPESNIQFGLGGAGTFSDGKLSTGTKGPRNRLVLETFVEAGAQREIAWDAKPHIGSDVLPGVVTNLVRRITELGGEVRCRCRLTGLDLADGTVRGVRLERREEGGLVVEERVPTSQVVLACGHSARDMFELLRDSGVALERKTFAMGVRIEHLQADIDRAQYGDAAGNPALGAAPYKLVAHLGEGRSAYSFCMCPGGFVVAAASEPGGVVTNGMSYAARDGLNANAGLLANVRPQDLDGDDPLAGVRLQRRCEQAAFAEGGGAFVAPAQLVGDFLKGQRSSAAGRVCPTYPRGVSWGSVEGCLPDRIVETLRAGIPAMARHLSGFDAPDAVLTGVETRSSSPVRVPRGTDGQSVSCRGLFPAGEGAGYAGGIMSAAVDGLAAADAVIAAAKDAASGLS